MDADRSADPRRHLWDRGLNSQCSARCALGIVVVSDRRTEDRHHTVADMPEDASAMFLNGTVGAIEELLEQRMNLFGIEFLAPRRGAGKIGEQHRHLSPFADRIGRRGRCSRPILLILEGRGLRGAQQGDRVEQLAAVTDPGSHRAPSGLQRSAGAERPALWRYRETPARIDPDQGCAAKPRGPCRIPDRKWPTVGVAAAILTERGRLFAQRGQRGDEDEGVPVPETRRSNWLAIRIRGIGPIDRSDRWSGFDPNKRAGSIAHDAETEDLVERSRFTRHTPEWDEGSGAIRRHRGVRAWPGAIRTPHHSHVRERCRRKSGAPCQARCPEL
jgi:hypothetical protein